MDYTIKAGDTLNQIAQANNTSVDNLSSLNKIADPNKIQAGQTIKIGATPTPVAPAITPATPLQMPDKINSNIMNAPVSPITPAPAITPQTQQPDIVGNLIAQTQVQETEAQKSQRELSNKISSLLPQTVGEGQALTEARQAQGIDNLAKELNGLNNEILLKQAELKKSDLQLAQSLQNIEDKPIAMEFITGQQQSVQRNADIARSLKNADIGILNARAIGLQGNIALAEQMAKSAVESKYAPIKETINLYQSQLKALEPLLSADEKKQANEQNIRTKFALQELETKQANEQSINKLIINASSQGAPASIVSQASQAKTPNEAAIILGQYAGDYLQNQKLRAEIAKLNGEVSGGTSTSSQDLTSIFKNNKIGEGTKTSISTMLGVINSLSSVAKENPTGEVEGVFPLSGLGFNALRSDKSIKNRGFIDAVNLKVQQWASGASLTKEQTDQVNKLVPQTSDTDSTTQSKMNSLTDFMNEQISATLQASGINYTAPKANLFNKTTDVNSKIEVADKAITNILNQTPQQTYKTSFSYK